MTTKTKSSGARTGVKLTAQLPPDPPVETVTKADGTVYPKPPEGIAGELGVDVSFCTPYSPWSKGQVERFMRRVHEQHDKLHVTYAGNSPESRPECLGGILRSGAFARRQTMKAKSNDRSARTGVKLTAQLPPDPPVETVTKADGTVYPKPPEGSHYARKGYEDLGWCPEHWDTAVMIYPAGSVRVLERASDRLTKEQCRLAVQMLGEGFVVGFSVTDGEEADLACVLAHRCPWPIRCVMDDDFGSQAYFVREDEVDDVAASIQS